MSYLCPVCGATEAPMEMQICHIRSGAVICKEHCDSCEHRRKDTSCGGGCLCGYHDDAADNPHTSEIIELNKEIDSLRRRADWCYRNDKPKQGDNYESKARILCRKLRELQTDA